MGEYLRVLLTGVWALSIWLLPHKGWADTIVADDQIVQGSQCIGFDCVNNESFGFDTLRLKENNLRIKFDDTSTTTGDPSFDWQLTANDSASGGANKFSIEDITNAIVPFTILGNAPSNSLFIDSTGRVGLRTATPELDLHIATNDTPAIRLEQNNSGGFAAQTWDMAGNEANFFIRDVTGGSQLPFRINPGAPTNSIYVASDGKVGFGTALPQGNLHINGLPTGDLFGGIGPDLINGPALNFGYSGASFGRSSGFFNVRPDATASAPNPSLRFATADVQAMIIDNVGNVGIGLAGLNPIPTQRLDVNGNIRASGSFISGATTLTVPDYVFAPDYKLLPLKELAAYVTKEQHLPDIPSAREIKTKGINLSEIQMLLLKKVEELTLYTLEKERINTQQEQTIRNQQQTIQRLSARLAALEKQQRPPEARKRGARR